jgi:hypothetical protein
MVENAARAIYGTILATALIAAYTEDPGSDPGQIAAAVFATTLVFWLAHGYAEAVARGASPDSAGPVATFVAGMKREWPLMAGAMIPAVPLLLAPLGLLSDDAAEDLALITGIGVLTVWGSAATWRRRRGIVAVALSAAASAFFGLVIVGLKAFVH